MELTNTLLMKEIKFIILGFMQCILGHTEVKEINFHTGELLLKYCKKCGKITYINNYYYSKCINQYYINTGKFNITNITELNKIIKQELIK